MKETMLRDFFLDKISASDLAADLQGSCKRLSPIASAVEISDMEGEFLVTRDMAVKLCDVVLVGELPAEDLCTIGFALMASDTFTWDADQDEILAEVIADWSCPEINYPLTAENVRRFRRWLNREEPYPEKPSHSKSGTSRILSSLEKRRLTH